ncbi:unnamed protein product [Adineta steineri]|nr:unnamed protein product [Adineta steineri]
MSRKQQRSGSQPPNEHVSQQQHPTRHMAINVTNETLLLSSFGWLIIDEIHYAASSGGLKVDGCMKKVQGNVSLSQRLRALQSTTNNQNTKKYDGSLILQIGSTSLSLKETLSTSTDNLPSTNIPTVHPSSSSTTSSTRQISVLDIIVGKSQALTSLQTRGISLTLSGVTNIGTIAMDVPLRPQEVHDLVNRAGRLITSYVQEFLPDDTQQTSSIPTTTNTDNELINTSLNDTIEEPTTPVPLEQTITRKRLGTRRRDTINRNINPRSLETQQNISTSSKRSIFEVHVTVHYERTTFFTILLSTLKAQYKIDVANIGRMKSVSSDNHVRLDFPKTRCYGNYSIQQEQESKTKDHLNRRTKIDVLKLTIAADFFAQLVFVSKVIIHEINEIFARASGFDEFHFGTTTKHTRLSSSTVAIMRIGSTDTENENEDEDDDEPKKDQQTTLSTLFTYKIDISMKGFEVMGQMPSTTIVKFENGDKKVPIFVKLTNYDEQNSLLLYNKPLIKTLLNIKLSLGQLLHTGSFQDAAYFQTKVLLKNSLQSDDPDKEAYFIRLTKPSFYRQPGAIDKGILFWLNYKNTYEHCNEQRGAFTTPISNSTRLRSIVNIPTSPAPNRELNLMFQLHIVDLSIAIPLQQYDPPAKLSTTDNITPSGLTTQQSIPTLDESSDFLVFTLDKTTISACSCGAIISSGSFEGFCFRFAQNFKQTKKSSNVHENHCDVQRLLEQIQYQHETSIKLEKELQQEKTVLEERLKSIVYMLVQIDQDMVTAEQQIRAHKSQT